MGEWTSHEARQADARAEYERIMTTPAPPSTGAYIDAGVIGFVFGEMWRRGVLTARDRRWITLSCVGAMDAAIPIETHVWAALNSGDVTPDEFDEFVLHFATQLGWPKGSALNLQGMVALARLTEERGEAPPNEGFVPWSDPVDDDTRRSRGEAAYRDVHGDDPPSALTAFRGSASIDFLYGEVWTRERYLTRRDRRIISICCAAAVSAVGPAREHLRAALASGDLSYEELQELVVHFAVYCGWALGEQLDDLLVDAATEVA
jgi:4-carboxymuconolactone decarboxylase